MKNILLLMALSVSLTAINAQNTKAWEYRTVETEKGQSTYALLYATNVQERELSLIKEPIHLNISVAKYKNELMAGLVSNGNFKYDNQHVAVSIGENEEPLLFELQHLEEGTVIKKADEFVALLQEHPEVWVYPEFIGQGVKAFRFNGKNLDLTQIQ